jgi:hypothetical protein
LSTPTAFVFFADNQFFLSQVPLAAFVADVLKPFDTAVKEKGLALCVVYDSEVRVCMCVCVCHSFSSRCLPYDMFPAGRVYRR